MYANSYSAYLAQLSPSQKAAQQIASLEGTILYYEIKRDQWLATYEADPSVTNAANLNFHHDILDQLRADLDTLKADEEFSRYWHLVDLHD